MADETKEVEEKKDKGESEEVEGGVGMIIVAILLILVVWAAIFALLVKMDVGGIGSTILYPRFKDTPIINKILPEAQEYAQEDAAYDYKTVDEAVRRIKELEAELAAVREQSGSDDARIADLEAQAAELAQYKQREQEFEATKEKFYKEVVFSDQSPDINAYKEYYESIEPEKAEAIYKQVVTQIQADEEIQAYAKTYSTMEPEAAAEVFNNMTDNLKLVAKILQAMDVKSRAAIMNNLDVDVAAALTKLMEP
jgi:flagellar motility protein MotE (MotC chaperone)